MFRQLLPWCGSAGGCGSEPDSLFSAHQLCTRRQLTEDADWLQFIAWTRESGSQPKTYLFAQNHVSWHPGSLVDSLCQKLLIALL